MTFLSYVIFTSHIVQIKHFFVSLCLKPTMYLYIPHSSDKTFYLLSSKSSKKNLYIPHSSDKTKFQSFLSILLADFTSHIVQIKLGFFTGTFRTFRSSLHPT